MTLQNFTTDELRAELKRRAVESRKAANANRDKIRDYLWPKLTNHTNVLSESRTSAHSVMRAV